MRPALYIHIPFCLGKCAYCDFASYPGRADVWDAYFATLDRELSGWIDLVGGAFSTVFIGGGTPSVVPARYIAALARRVRTGEFTIEANPGTLTREKLCAYLDSGVNRLSMGVQAFDDALLARIGRLHTAEDARRAFDLARAAGFQNISLDLMYALPGQTMAQWAHTLDCAAALAPEHLSAYSLIVEPGTPIANWAKPFDEDLIVRMQRHATRRLAGAGYARYEISNYARPGYECAHNVNYWTRGDYIGIGCAAHSLYGGARFANPASLDEYLAGARRVDESLLTPQDAVEETVLLGTRMTRGIPLTALPDERAARTLVNQGFAQLRGGQFSLTERGLELQNAAVQKLLEDV
ncbi:MAG: radical SAM family heme chaperone HemW [Christensenellales bacterium]|jgi:oxygen-independent coproporphyrinogen-3 oxidase